MAVVVALTKLQLDSYLGLREGRGNGGGARVVAAGPHVLAVKRLVRSSRER